MGRENPKGFSLRCSTNKINIYSKKKNDTLKSKNIIKKVSTFICTTGFVIFSGSNPVFPISDMKPESLIIDESGTLTKSSMSYLEKLFDKWSLKEKDVLVILVNKIAKGGIYSGSSVPN